MSIDTLRQVVEWLKGFQNDQITLTFHGGEPLLAGARFYREALPLLTKGLASQEPTFAMQTNLWRLTPEIASILAEYHVPLGSSLDGPKEVNDSQRGEGYFEKTLRGYRIAIDHGLKVSFICTFTAQSVKYREEIVQFFMDNGFTLKLHPALPSLRSHDPAAWALPPEEYGDLLEYLLEVSLEHLDTFEIMNINDLVKGVMIRHGTVCTFVDCMDSTYAVGPDGWIYPCYRFVGMDDYRMGHVQDRPTREELTASPAGQMMQAFKRRVDQSCGTCKHRIYCRGGCPYNAIVPGDGSIQGVDPYCVAYKRIFEEITRRLEDELYGSCALERSPFTFGPKMGEKPGIMALMQRIVTR
jgi:Arylsulfatase regulator (Fe-S oxidoreductase)